MQKRKETEKPAREDSGLPYPPEDPAADPYEDMALVLCVMDARAERQDRLKRVLLQMGHHFGTLSTGGLQDREE